LVPADPFVDIHCHLLPGIDDGAADLETSLAMAQMAVDEGIETLVATPHQLGNFAHNRGADIRRAVADLQKKLATAAVPLRILPGGDVRIEPELVALVRRGEVLTLADRGRHVLLELPHELYVPLEPILDELDRAGLVGILSHPERNQGILRRPAVCGPLVDRGCLLQMTAGSLLGSFGPASGQLAEMLLTDGLVHFLATDAHGIRGRRPRMRAAFERAAELVGYEHAVSLCCGNPARVAAGEDVVPGRSRPSRLTGGGFLAGLFGRRKAS